MTDASERRARLSADRRALLDRLRDARGGTSGAAPVRAPDGGRTGERPPLSVAQEQLWFLDQLTPGQPTYNIGQATLITGRLDRAALQGALADLVARHAALRTTFAVDAGTPYQVVAEPEDTSLSVSDLTGLAEAERETAAIRHVTDEEVGRPFDLARGPLFRARLYLLGGERHVLALTVHHSVADGWSLRVLKRELGELYAARRAGRPATLPPPALQYPDYCVWQREQVANGGFEEQLRHWETHLRDLPAVEPPTDRPRPAVASYRGETVATDFAPGTRAAVRGLARRFEVTDFMVLTAAFNALLSRYTQTDDIVIGTTVSGRSRPEFADLVGFLVNMVVLRTDLSGDPTFAELLGRVKDTCLAAWSAQDVPFEQVVDRLRPVRDPSRNPLFQVGLQLLGAETSGGALRLEGTRTEPLRIGFGRSRFDMSVSVLDDGTELSVDCEYATDLFDRTRIMRMFRHLEILLRAAADDPATRVGALPLLSETERDTILRRWQGPDEERDHRPVHERIADVAARHPDQPAVRMGATELTYAELMGRADALARYLAANGIGRESIVAVALHRGIDVAVALVGVLRAGAAFVVVDPDHPVRRLEFILKDTGATIMLTRSELLDRLPVPGAWAPLCLDTDWPRITGHTGGPEPDRAGEDALAYVLYTSGSTGEPKGVGVEHHALNTFVHWMGGIFDFDTGDRILQHMSLIFDFAEGEMMTALSRGSTLVFLPEERRGDAEAFGEMLRAERITYVGGPPAILNRIPPGDYPDLRYMIAGGEAVPPELVDRWSRAGVRFVNGYGPTEAAVGCIYYECEPRRWTGQPPIGRAMPLRTAYVLDRHDRLVPVGVPGEIVVGGEGLARGYLNRPELTAERFVDDPFRPGGRMYRTGDLGMWTEAGQIQFLGRIDSQVKLNGLRIELEEIETSLARHPAVAAAAVSLRTDPPRGSRLVGYIVPAAGATPPSRAELRRHLLDEVPAYMVPSAFVTVEELPLSRVGKVDRGALPAPGEETVAAYVAPRTPAEKRVAEIFAQVLGVEEPGVHTGFFDLGGNSLRTTQVLARLGREFGETLSLREFYASPTVESVARLMAGDGERAGTSAVVTLRPGMAAAPIYLVPAVSGSPYWYTGLARLLDPARPVRAFVSPGLEGEAEPISDLGALAAHFLAALRADRPSGPYLLAGWSMGGVVAYEMGRRLAADGEKVLVAALDSGIPGPADAPDETRILQMFASDLAGLADRPIPSLDAVLAESGDARDTALARVLAEGRLIPDDVAEGFAAQRYAVFSANVRALHTYAPPGGYEGALLLVDAERSADASDRWRALAPQASVRVVPGDHYSMWAEPGLSAIATILGEAVAAAE